MKVFFAQEFEGVCRFFSSFDASLTAPIQDRTQSLLALGVITLVHPRMGKSDAA